MSKFWREGLRIVQVVFFFFFFLGAQVSVVFECFLKRGLVLLLGNLAGVCGLRF